MKKKFFLSCLLIVMALLPAVAQIQDPVQFKTELKTISDTEAQIVFTGKIDAGWHVYSTDLPSGGPISATFNVDKIEGVELVGKLTPQGKEIENFDKVFEMKLRYKYTKILHPRRTWDPDKCIFQGMFHGMQMVCQSGNHRSLSAADVLSQ